MRFRPLTVVFCTAQGRGEGGEGLVHDVVDCERLDDVLERAVLQILQSQFCRMPSVNNF